MTAEQSAVLLCVMIVCLLFERAIPHTVHEMGSGLARQGGKPLQATCWGCGEERSSMLKREDVGLGSRVLNFWRGGDEVWSRAEFEREGCEGNADGEEGSETVRRGEFRDLDVTFDKQGCQGWGGWIVGSATKLLEVQGDMEVWEGPGEGLRAVLRGGVGGIRAMMREGAGGKMNVKVKVMLEDNTVVTGLLVCVDKHLNIVLKDGEEFRPTKGAPLPFQIRSFGLVLIRGDNVVSISFPSSKNEDKGAMTLKGGCGSAAFSSSPTNQGADDETKCLVRRSLSMGASKYIPSTKEYYDRMREGSLLGQTRPNDMGACEGDPGKPRFRMRLRGGGLMGETRPDYVDAYDGNPANCRCLPNCPCPHCR